jgi:hypothetical protein
VSFTPSQIANACRFWASNVAPLPPSLDGARLLWALAGNESSFGVNVMPRHEPAYDLGGALAGSMEQSALLERYGSAAACSYGPWQIMLVNAPEGTAPEDFEDLNTAAICTVGFLNSQLRRFKPLTLTTIGQIWNHGSPTNAMTAGVAAYVAELAKNYDVPIPEAT